MLDQDEWIADYKFDTANELWSRVTLAVSILSCFYNYLGFNFPIDPNQVTLSVQKVYMSSSLRIRTFAADVNLSGGHVSVGVFGRRIRSQTESSPVPYMVQTFGY